MLILGGLFVAVMGGYGLRTPWTALRVDAREPNDVMDAPAGGHVELEGTARPAAGTIDGPFLVDDGTGTVLVEPGGARTNLSMETEIRVGGEEPPARLRRFIESNPTVDSENTSLDLNLIELNTGNDRRYVERRLDPEEDVHVLGPRPVRARRAGLRRVGQRRDRASPGR
ncbi:MAG: hypothetical protein V5A33_04865 [Halobacteriales archaeon]